jgi:hypothetical protein
VTRPEQVDVQVGLARRCDVILAMLTTRQPCQPARGTHRREIADAA